MADGTWKIAVATQYDCSCGSKEVDRITVYAFIDSDGEIKTAVDKASFPDILKAKARDPAYDGIGLHVNMGPSRGGYQLHPLDQFALDERKRRTRATDHGAVSIVYPHEAVTCH